MSEITYTWISVEKRCSLCDGGTRIPPYGCWKCNGAGVYRVARLTPVAGDGAGVQTGDMDIKPAPVQAEQLSFLEH